MKHARVRGTQDILPPDIYTWRHVERVFEGVCARFGYEPLRTPIFESTDLFLRTVGEGTDIVSKEMYTFPDRGGRSLTLRPENTAAVIRAFLEAGMHRQGGISRFSYVGPMFRYDRPQAGRYRQFHQLGVEAIGASSPALDVEVIDLFMTTVEELGFAGLTVRLNSVGCRKCRPAYTEVLREALKARKDRLCDDCQERAIKNPLRVFDCKRDVEIRKELPMIGDHLCEECGTHMSRVKALLALVGRGFEEDPHLVRGLDYYTRTTFEVVHGDLGAQNALCGGGRYDDLVEECGGPSTPAVGFSAGLERIIAVLPESSRSSATGERVDFYVVCADDTSEARALAAAKALRASGAVEVDVSMRVLKTQLKGAEKKAARIVVIVGQDSPNQVKWKDMDRRTQTEIEDRRLGTYAGEFFRKREKD